MKPIGRLLAVLFLVTLGAGSALAAQSPQIPLAGGAIPQFVDPLPTLSVSGGAIETVFGNQPLDLKMCEFKASVLPAGAVAGYTGTWVWGYLVDPVGGQIATS